MSDAIDRTNLNDHTDKRAHASTHAARMSRPARATTRLARPLLIVQNRRVVTGQTAVKSDCFPALQCESRQIGQKFVLSTVIKTH